MAKKTAEAEMQDFTQAIGLLVRRLRAAGRSQDLSLTESAVLARLDREGPATTADLARAEGVKPQSMGATVSALETAAQAEKILGLNIEDFDLVGRRALVKAEGARAKTRLAARRALALGDRRR